MSPTADLENKAAPERFAQLSAEEKAAVLPRGQLIQTLEDLEDIPEADAAQLRPIIEAQTATP